MASKRWIGHAAVVMAMVGGFIAIVAPVYIADPDARELDLRELAGHSIEELRFVPTLILLFIVGVILGAVWGRLPGVIGCGTVGFYFLNLGVDLFFLFSGFDELASNSHNLWPFELVILAVFCVPGFIGALVGIYLYRRLQRRPSQLSNDL